MKDNLFENGDFEIKKVIIQNKRTVKLALEGNVESLLKMTFMQKAKRNEYAYVFDKDDNLVGKWYFKNKDSFIVSTLDLRKDNVKFSDLYQVA